MHTVAEIVTVLDFNNDSQQCSQLGINIITSIVHIELHCIHHIQFIHYIH
jgi:hypothetical protein